MFPVSTAHLFSLQSALLLALSASLIESSVGVDYGKVCDHDDDCRDFRLVCSPDNTCVCSRFFHYHPVQKICHLNMTELKHFLDNLSEERDHRGELDAHAKSTFNKLGLAGILALSLGIVGASCCVFAFCILDRKPGDIYSNDKTKVETSSKQQDPGANLAAATGAGPSDPTVLTVPVDLAMDII